MIKLAYKVTLLMKNKQLKKLTKKNKMLNNALIHKASL